jgi:hypothetical protein
MRGQELVRDRWWDLVIVGGKVLREEEEEKDDDGKSCARGGKLWG